MLVVVMLEMVVVEEAALVAKVMLVVVVVLVVYMLVVNGVFEPEGAGTSPLNSVSDGNMCLTENRHFSTYQINIFVSVRV